MIRSAAARQRLLLCAASAVALALGAAPASGGIRTDGSTGRAVTLKGPNYLIGSGLGTLAGSNLFLSFSYFDLANGQSATFAGPSSLANIIARVTGGDASSIDGGIATKTGGKPNLFLINPAGVVFGKDSSLATEGSFYVSTADYLKFADGAKLVSHPGKGSSFTTAAPAAFGFLKANPAAVAVNGSKLSVNAGSTLNIVGGGLRIAGGQITAPGGTIEATSVASTGEVPLDPANAKNLTVTAFGTASIGGGAKLDVGNTATARVGGSLYVHAGKLTVDNSTLAADNNGSSPGGTIALTGAQQVMITKGALVGSTAYGAGSSGAISLTGGNVVLIKGSSIFTSTNSSGRCGAIAINASGMLEITSAQDNFLSGYEISTGPTVYGTGNAGNVTIVAGQAKIIDAEIVTHNGYQSGDSGNINVSVTGALQIDRPYQLPVFASAGIYAYSDVGVPTGGIGHITVSAGSITISGAARIATLNSSSGEGGAITVAARGDLSIRGIQNASPAGIIAGNGNGGAGDAGSVTVSANSINIGPSAEISSSSLGLGNAGNVKVEVVGALEIDGGTTSNAFFGDTAISADSTYSDSGNAGQVNVSAGSIKIINGGKISSETSGQVNGGNVTVNTRGTLEIDGIPDTVPYSAPLQTGILADVGPFGTGNGGNINVNAGSIKITKTGQITASSSSSGNGGNITVGTTGFLEIVGDPNSIESSGGFTAGIFSEGVAGNITLRAGNIEVTKKGKISGNAFGLQGNAGRVVIAAASIKLSEMGTISNLYAGFGMGTGGDIVIKTTGALEIDGDAFGDPNDISPANRSAIIAAAFGDGNAGRIAVTAGDIKITEGGQISSSSYGTGKGGDITINTTGSIEIEGYQNLLTGITAATYLNVPPIFNLPSGDAGEIKVTATNIKFTRGGVISTDTFGSGNAGSVMVTADSLTLLGGSSLSSASTVTASGDAGTVTVAAADLALSSGSVVSSSASGSGSAGTVKVSLTGVFAADGFGTGIFSQATGYGNAGDVALSAKEITFSDGAAASSDAGLFGGKGAGGIVTVNASDTLNLTGNGTEISANALGSTSGAAGTVSVTAPKVLISDGALIGSSAAGVGKGGDIIVSANDLELGGGLIKADSTGPGGAGSVSINVGTVTLAGGALLSAQGSGTGPAGDITIDAGNMTIDRSSISTQSASGGGGNLSVTVPGLLAIDGGGMTTAVQGGDLNAGNVTVRAGLLLLDSSQLSANAYGGRGGNILIVADGILATPDSAVSASSAKGVSGTVALESLASDVTAGLAPLSGKLGIAENVSPLACGIRVRGREKQSTLVLRGRGRLPADGEGPLDLPYGGGTGWAGPLGSVLPLAPERSDAIFRSPCG